MNNSRGAALLDLIREGDLVTVRRADGGQSTGRAVMDGTYLRIQDRTGTRYGARADNIISFRKKD